MKVCTYINVEASSLSFFSSVLPGRAKHQTTVFHIPLADTTVIPGVPLTRRNPYLGHPVFWWWQIPIPHSGLLCHAHVRFSHFPHPLWAPLHLKCSYHLPSLLILIVHRLIRDSLLAGDFTVNMRLLQVLLYFICIIITQATHLVQYDSGLVVLSTEYHI